MRHQTLMTIWLTHWDEAAHEGRTCVAPWSLPLGRELLGPMPNESGLRLTSVSCF